MEESKGAENKTKMLVLVEEKKISHWKDNFLYYSFITFQNCLNVYINSTLVKINYFRICSKNNNPDISIGAAKKFPQRNNPYCGFAFKIFSNIVSIN